MTDLRQSNQEWLVPTGTAALATGSAGLVRRGLHLIAEQQHKKRKVRILVGESQKALIEVIIDAINCSLNDQYELLVTSTDQASQLLDYARSQQFDLCVAILNNLHYPPDYPRPTYTRSTPVAEFRAKFTDMASQFVADLKQDSRLPVIALAGEGAISCPSADYYFPLPFPIPEFIEAVKTCLSVKRGLGLMSDGQLKRRKVLATDDDVWFLEKVKTVCESSGYEVVTITDKAEALARFAEIKPDLVTTDLVSPGLDGYHFIRLLKEDHPSIPVIVISAFVGPMERRARELGVFDCVDKWDALRQPHLLLRSIASANHSVYRSDLHAR